MTTTAKERAIRTAYMREWQRAKRERAEGDQRRARLNRYWLTERETQGAVDAWMLKLLARAKREGRLRADGTIHARSDIKIRITPHYAYHVLRGPKRTRMTLKRHLFDTFGSGW